MILLDISTSYHFRHWNPMGILRVEHEVYKGFSQRFTENLVPAIFDQETDAYYKIPEDIFDELIFRNGLQPTPPDRPAKSKSRWQSWGRILRFLYKSRKLRRVVSGGGDATYKAQEDVVANELLRISLEEFGMMVLNLKKVGFLSQGIRDRITLYEHVNHHAHHGLRRTIHDDLCVEANRIDPTTIEHYVSVGGFWSDDRYRHAYNNRCEFGWTNHYLVYDLVPILWGHVAEPTTRETFPVAMHWMLWGVDQVWTISETTKRDLVSHVAANGYPELPPNWVKPVRLGSDISHSELSSEEERAVFDKYDLTSGHFVLMVGTLEPRKNHDFAYRLWREMHNRSEKEVMPLVWVGQPGWAIQPLLDMIKQDHGLPHNAIRILSSVSDSELVALYEACRFTIYPSHYEGWGLPVVESLTHKKPCIVSAAPSLAEAGAGAVEVIDTLDGGKWLGRCLELMHSDDEYEAALEHAAKFKEDEWDAFRDVISSDFSSFLTERSALAEFEENLGSGS